MTDSNKPETDTLKWAIEARARSQRLLLALYSNGQYRDADPLANPDARVFSLLAGIAFSLWRAAFLADAPTRTGTQALAHAYDLLGEVLKSNTIAFSTDQRLQGWTGGYYLNNAKLRLVEAFTIQLRAAEAEQVRSMSLYDADPRNLWNDFCERAEELARTLGCS